MVFILNTGGSGKSWIACGSFFFVFCQEAWAEKLYFFHLCCARLQVPISVTFLWTLKFVGNFTCHPTVSMMTKTISNAEITSVIPSNDQWSGTISAVSAVSAVKRRCHQKLEKARKSCERNKQSTPFFVLWFWCFFWSAWASWQRWGFEIAF